MLFGKQVIMLPVAFFDIGFLISLVIGQRKLDTLTLQGIIGSKIIDEIVERFVRFCRFGLFRQFLLEMAAELLHQQQCPGAGHQHRTGIDGDFHRREEARRMQDPRRRFCWSDHGDAAE